MTAFAHGDGGRALVGQLAGVQLYRSLHLTVVQVAAADLTMRVVVFGNSYRRCNRRRDIDDGGARGGGGGTGGIGAGGNQRVGALRQRGGRGDGPVAITAHHSTANDGTGGIGDDDSQARNASAVNGRRGVIGGTDTVDAHADRHRGIAGGVGLYRLQIDGRTTSAIAQCAAQCFAHAHQADKAVAALIGTTCAIQTGGGRIKLGQRVLAIFQGGQHLLCFRCQLGHGGFSLVRGLRLHGFGGQRHFARAIYIEHLAIGTGYRQGGAIQQHHMLTRMDDVSGLEDTLMPLGINRFGNAVNGNDLTLDSCGAHV